VLPKRQMVVEPSSWAFGQERIRDFAASDSRSSSLGTVIKMRSSAYRSTHLKAVLRLIPYRSASSVIVHSARSQSATMD